MPLPIGLWKVNINGKEGDLNILSVFEGKINARVLLHGNISGIWDEVSQTIIFALTSEGLSVAVFKGHLLRTPENPAPGRDVVATLTGFVQVDGDMTLAGGPSLPGTPRRNVFGWFAQITEVV